MPVLTVNDQQFTIPSGQTRLGGGADADVRVGDDSAGIQAVIEFGSDGRAVIRRGPDGAVVRVNGVTLGVEPTPLLHGDKVDIGGKELTFSDDVAAGATEFVSADQVAALIQKRGGPARATAGTGGRLVSLVDGKEYTVPEAGITIGRDASAGVVVPQREVSRIHAEILPSGNGYMIHDRSTNGLYVNGTRVQGSQLLSRADVIRAGTEEFRFYADVAAAGAKPAEPSARPQTPVLPNIALDMVPLEAETARAAEPKLAPTTAQPSTPRVPAPAPAPPARPAEPERPALAVVEIIAEGPNKGKTFDIRTPLAHVGRGAHNDIVLADDSVSDSHAKIQRRDDGWYVVDLASTNGTYVGGTRIIAERRLDGSPDLRFGGIKTIFRPKDQGMAEGTGTRAIAAFRAPERPPAPRSSTTAPAPSAAQASTPTPPAKGGGMPVWVWIVIGVAVVGGVVVVLLNR